MQAIVLVGGRGTRLGAELPKPLAPLAGLSVLEHVLGWLAREGAREIVVCSGYRADAIVEAVGDGARFGVSIVHSIEPAPLGTAGAVRHARRHLRERFVIAYGDVVADVDLAAMMNAHVRAGAIATLAVHPNDHPLDSDRVIADRHGWVQRMVRKEERAGPEAGALCNAALYVLERSVIDAIPEHGSPRDFARDVLPAICGERSRVLAYRTVEYLKDMGTPDRRARVERDLVAGVPAAMRMRAPKPAAFLDRDGVITEDVPHLDRPERLAILPGAAHALARLNRAHVLALAATNQPVVARGALSLDGLHELHRTLEGMLGAEHAWLDAIWACPHHPERGFEGERPELKIACACRKPLPGMLNEAIGALGIDRRTSIFVGDRTVDLEAARAAGVLGIGVLTGAACLDRKHPLRPETPIVPDASAAISLLLDTAPSWAAWIDRAIAAGTVLLGGRSRAGKTIAANALRLALGARGIPSTHVSLDRFLVPRAERAAGLRLRERARADLAASTIGALAAGEHVLLPGYDPSSSARAPGEVLRRSGVLIVEGLLALEIDVPGALAIEVVASADDVRARRRAFYAWKGLADHANADLIEDEESAVATACARASLRLRIREGRLEEESAR